MKGMVTLLAGGTVGFLLGSMAGRDPYDRVQQLTTNGWHSLPRDGRGRLIVHPKALVNAGTDAVDASVETSPAATPPHSEANNEGRTSRTGFEQFPAAGLIG